MRAENRGYESQSTLQGDGIFVQDIDFQNARNDPIDTFRVNA